MATYRKLGMVSSHRNLMLRNMTTDLLKHGRITTTETRAKELKRMADKMITLGKRGDLHARRQALSYIFDETVVKNLFEEIAPKYAERNGGYSRIIKTMPRRGDSAPMAIIELV
ncbi:MAG: 50S ribosomal protein L17 [Proteocatella sp.]